MSIPVESRTSLEGSQGTESSSPGSGSGGLKAETDLEVLNTKLYVAAREGDINSVQSLLSQGANVNNQDNWRKWTPLHIAASRGHNEVVSVLLSNGADPNIKDRYGDTPLYDAASEGRNEVVSVLLSNGADPNIKDRDEDTPLHIAASRGHNEVVSVLLSNGADPNIKDTDEDTPLRIAASRGHNEVVSVLLSNGADPNIKDRRGDTALVVAMRDKHDEIVQLICEQTDPNITVHNYKLYEAAKKGDSIDVQSALSQGANVNYQNHKENGATSLLIAAKEGHHNVINVMLSAGADVNLMDTVGDTALIVSARGGDYETVKVLLDNGADLDLQIHLDYECGTTALMAAVNNKHHHVVELLLTKGADPNLMDNEGDIALIVLARRGDHETVKVLLDNGADPNIGQEWEYPTTALIEATREGHSNVVELLLSKGADPNCIDEEADTALIVSARGGNYETVKVLLDNGADPNEWDGVRTTALMAAINNKHHHVVELLLTEGADPSIMDNEGDIALIVSARRGDYETVKVLLDNGADPNIGQEWDFPTPLIEAAIEQHTNVVELLLSKGADPNSIDGDGDTVLIVSARGGDYETVEVLLDNGSDPNIDQEFEYFSSPLIEAAAKGHYQVVELLLTKGADPNIISKDGDTALTAAVKEGHYDIVLLLLTNKADPNLNEPLIMAASKGRHDIVSLLLSKGADPDTVDKSGRTAIGEAMDCRHKNIVELLQNHARSIKPVSVYPSLLPTTPQASSNPFLPPYNYSSLQYYPQPQAPVSYSPSYSSQPLFPAPQPLYCPPAPGYVPNQPYYSSIRMQQPFNPQHINPVLYPLSNTTERMEYSQPSASSTVPSKTSSKDATTSVDNVAAVAEKLEELQCYLPQLSKMIDRRKDRGPSNELNKLQNLYKVIQTKNTSISMSTLEKSHNVLKRMFSEDSSNDESVRDKASINTTFEEIDQKYLQKAMEDGLVESSVTKTVVQGEARVGKSSVKSLLVSEPYTDNTSTNLIESPCVAVRCYGHTGKYWERINEEEMGIKVIAAVQSDAMKKFECHPSVETKESEPVVKKKSIKATKPISQHTGGKTSKPKSQNESVQDSQSSMDVVSSSSAITPDAPVTIEFSNEKNAVVRVREFYQKCKKSQKEGTSLHNRRWLYFIDSGGQIQFQKLLPAFMPYASVLLLVVNLSKDLTDPSSTAMQLSEEEINVGQYSLSVIEVLKQLLSAITSSAQQYRSLIADDSTLSKCIKPPSDKLKVLPVATHRDEYDETRTESVEEKKKQLKQVFKLHDSCKIIGHEGRIFLHEIDGRDALTVDHNRHNPNLDKIVKILDESAYEIKVPLKWYCFGVLLHDVAKESCGILSLSYCQELGQQLKVGLSSEESLSAIKFLSFLNKLLFYPDSPASDLVFVNLESLINIIRDLVVSICKDHSAVNNDLLPNREPLVSRGELSTEILMEASEQCRKISQSIPKFESKILGLFEYLLIAAPMPNEGCFLMPALLPIKNVSDINPFPDTTPLLLYFKAAVPMGLFCAIIVHLLSHKDSSWNVAEEESNFSNYFTLRCPDLLRSDIVLVEQLDCITVYCEAADDYIPVRDAVEEAVNVAMSKHKLSTCEKPKRAFYCPCGKGWHAAVASWLKTQNCYVFRCTSNNKPQSMARECLSWLYKTRKRQHDDELQNLPDIPETNVAYQVLVDSTTEIKDHFSDDYSDFADKLLEMNVITERERNTITDRNTCQDKYQRMGEVIDYVKKAVQIKESVFILFLNIFHEKGTQSSTEFARKLMQRYKDKTKLSDVSIESLSKRTKQSEHEF